MGFHEAHCNAGQSQPVGCPECSCESGREIKRLRSDGDRLREALRQIKLRGLTTGYGRTALSRLAHEALNYSSSPENK